MKLFKQIISYPFVLVGSVLFFLGLAIRFGFEDTNKILKSLTSTVKKYKNKE